MELMPRLEICTTLAANHSEPKAPQAGKNFFPPLPFSCHCIPAEFPSPWRAGIARKSCLQLMTQPSHPKSLKNKIIAPGLWFLVFFLGKIPLFRAEWRERSPWRRIMEDEPLPHAQGTAPSFHCLIKSWNGVGWKEH